ncbi:hypothetical protein cypCar_00000295 [Cyprinus carpio]|nr:hypothetical protein cypCar_00000295 [Cyprinus carpio]
MLSKNTLVVSLSVSEAECSEKEFGQLLYRLLDWFLLLSRMGERYTPAAPSQSCLTHTQRTQLVEYGVCVCAHRSCDKNKNKKVTLSEWTSCLVDRSERWFQDFM